MDKEIHGGSRIGSQKQPAREPEEKAEAHHLTVEVCNQKGLHARASAQFVKLAVQFEATISVGSKGRTVSGSSIIGLMMLGAGTGASLELSASGREAKTALAALANLVKNKFNEDR